MKKREDIPGKQRQLRRTLISFVSAMLLGLLVTAMLLNIRYQKTIAGMDYIAETVGSETRETLLSQLSKTKVLEAYLMESGGEFAGCEEIAEMLLEEGCVRNVLFAPDGVVRFVYPLKGNEDVIGLDMKEEGAGNREAQAAIEKGELYMAGPFELIQGGMGIAGRLPVSLKDADGEKFWGIVSVTLDYPEVLESSSINRINEQGYACRIWRINPDDNLEQTILETSLQVPENTQIRNYSLSLFNSEWTISMAPLKAWYRNAALAAGIITSILAGAAVAFAVYNVEKVRIMRTEQAKRRIEELQQELEQKELKMLLSQISSHFFYHTLNSLQALIVLQPDAAYKMAGDFSRYIRFSLDSITNSSGIGSFREELRAVRAYADINQQQLGDRLHMEYINTDGADFQIPVLTIQPVVENAILHGIKPKVGGGTVRIELEDAGENWKVLVEDDGVGFDASQVSDETSIGIANVRKRLEKCQGCSIMIESSPGSGTKVVIIYKKADEVRH